MVQGVHLVVFGDAMRIAKNAGMDLGAVAEALKERMGGTTAMAARDYDKDMERINFSTELITKDMRYAKKLANGASTTLLDEALKRFEEAIQKGHGSEDWTAVTKI